MKPLPLAITLSPMGSAKNLFNPELHFIIGYLYLVLYGIFRYHSLIVKGPQCIRRNNGGDTLTKFAGKQGVKHL